MFTKTDMSSLLKSIYCTKNKNKEPRNGGVHSSKGSVDGVHAGQSRSSSKSIPFYSRFQRKGLYQQQQDRWGKVMLDCIQPLGEVPGAAAYQAVPTTIALSLQALTQSPRTAGWRCVYQCPSNIHGKMVLGNVH